MKNLISLENLVAWNKIPLINAIFYPNGDLLVIDSKYIGDKFNLQIICKSSIKSFFNYNDLNIAFIITYFKDKYEKFIPRN